MNVVSSGFSPTKTTNTQYLLLVCNVLYQKNNVLSKNLLFKSISQHFLTHFWRLVYRAHLFTVHFVLSRNDRNPKNTPKNLFFY